MRADYLGECAAYPALASALSGRTVLVGAMSRDELARVIEGPAARAGLTVERRLRDSLLDEVVEEPGAAPAALDVAARAVGGPRGRRVDGPGIRAQWRCPGAVARLAEAAHGRLTPAERDAARRILLRLADTGAGGQVVRRRVPLAELDADRDANARTALAALARDRLVILDEGSVEVAHEALFREWPRLRAWLEENVEHLGVRRRLTDAATAWEAGGRDSAIFFAVPGSPRHSTGRPAAGADLNEVERAFLAASREAAQSAEQRGGGRTVVYVCCSALRQSFWSPRPLHSPSRSSSGRVRRRRTRAPMSSDWRRSRERNGKSTGRYSSRARLSRCPIRRRPGGHYSRRSCVLQRRSACTGPPSVDRSASPRHRSATGFSSGTRRASAL